MTVRYDQLVPGDIIKFHGANERVTKVIKHPAPANEWYPDECTVSFEIEPADADAVKMLGNFYSHGEYGGVGCLEIEKIG